MNLPQIFNSQSRLHENAAESLRTVLHKGNDLNIVLWQIPPQCSLPPHKHPSGEDVWLVLQGEAQLLDGTDTPRRIGAGDCVAIAANQVHGVFNHGTADCVLVSVVQATAGFESVQTAV